jgi:hypothetical protein
MEKGKEEVRRRSKKKRGDGQVQVKMFEILYAPFY